MGGGRETVYASWMHHAEHFMDSHMISYWLNFFNFNIYTDRLHNSLCIMVIYDGSNRLALKHRVLTENSGFSGERHTLQTLLKP